MLEFPLMVCLLQQGGKNIYFFSTFIPIPLWNYSDGNYVQEVAISSNGSYIAVETGVPNYGTYLFNSSITIPKSPMWNYSKDMYNHIAISADGFYIAVSDDDLTALYNRTSSVLMITFWGRVRKSAISSNGSYIAVETGVPNYGTYLFNSSITIPKSPMWNYSKDMYNCNRMAEGKIIS